MMMAKRFCPNQLRFLNRGMTLIEVLVGVAIGLIGLIVMFQVLSVWDARTRTNTAGGDAQVAGSIAMYNIERDIRLAGMGFGDADAAEMAPNCLVQGFDNTAGATFTFQLAPVVIRDNDLAQQPDEIAVLYGNSPFFVTRETFNSSTPFSVQTSSRVGFRAGDLAVVTDRGCIQRLVQVTDEPTTTNDRTLSYNAGSYNDFYANGTSKPARYNTAAGWGTIFSAGNVYNLGPTPRRNNWSVDGDVLRFQDDLGGSPFFGVAEGVIDLKAQYGIDVNGDSMISGVGEWTKVLPVPTDWTRIRAIRVAILVRSRNFEKPAAASSADSSWSAPNPSWSGGNFVMKNVDGTPDSAPIGGPNNWRHYRYKVYERIIPLRNVIWNQ